jgi:lysophospholipase L1-like esterase
MLEDDDDDGRVVRRPGRLARARHFFLRKSVAGSAALLPLNSRIVFLGDSITSARGFSGFADWALSYAGGRYALPKVGSNGAGPTGWNQGVSGNTSTQVLARIANVTADAPAVCPVLIGTNDIGTTSDSAATITGRIRSIYDGLLVAGIRPIGLTLLPRTAFDAGQNARLAGVNEFILGQSDILKFDTHSRLPNPSLPDGTHPDATDAQNIGYGVGSFGEYLASLIAPTSKRYTYPTAGAANLLGNPFFEGGATVATGWSFFQNTNGLTKAASKQTIDGREAQRYVASGTASNANADNFNRNITIAGLTGTIVEAWVAVRVIKDTNLGSLAIGMGVNTAAGTMFSVTAVNTAARTVPYDLVLRTPQFASTSDNQTYSVRLSMVPTNAAVHDIDIAFLDAGYEQVA